MALEERWNNLALQVGWDGLAVEGQSHADDRGGVRPPIPGPPLPGEISCPPRAHFLPPPGQSCRVRGGSRAPGPAPGTHNPSHTIISRTERSHSIGEAPPRRESLSDLAGPACAGRGWGARDARAPARADVRVHRHCRSQNVPWIGEENRHQIRVALILQIDATTRTI